MYSNVLYTIVGALPSFVSGITFDYGVNGSIPYITVNGHNILWMINNDTIPFISYFKALIGAYLLISMFTNILNQLPRILSGDADLVGGK